MPTPTAVSEALREADRLGVTVLPYWLPESARYLYGAVYDGLAAARLTPAQRRRVALDAAAHLCAETSGVRLTPRTVGQADPLLRCCFAHHGLDPDRATPPALEQLRLICRGGLKVPTLRSVADRLRNERMRRDYVRGEGYDAIGRRHGLSVAQVRRILGAGDE